MIILHDWQQHAMNKIKSTLGGSIVTAATGTGKTVLAMKLIEDNPTSRFMVVVPTVVLQTQWRDEIIKFGVATIDEISLIGDGNKGIPDQRITIAIVNSLWRFNWDHHLSQFDYTILDEVHRYASEMNSKPIKVGNLGYKLGLTATIKRSDNLDIILHQLIGPVVYSIDKDEAIAQGYICEYEVQSVPCKLTSMEVMRYSDIDTKVKQTMSLFNNSFPMIQSIIKQGYRHTMFRHACDAMQSIQDRKGFLTKVESKADEAIKLCIAHQNDKVILFDELQDSANKIYKQLTDLGVNCVLYHSKIKGKEKKAAIKAYTEGSSNILISVRCLDEGLDVKNADVGIIVNGNSQERQILQRLGRILRKKAGKVAKLYMLYVPGTQDEKYLQKRMAILGGNNLENA